MFARRVTVEIVGDTERPAPLKHIDTFAMRNFTNDAIFDDTLPIADGLMEIGDCVPVERLRDAMEEWFRRKSYIGKNERLRVTEPSPL